MIAAGADVNATTEDGQSPLLVASEEGDLECVQVAVNSLLSALIEVIFPDSLE